MLCEWDGQPSLRHSFRHELMRSWLAPTLRTRPHLRSCGGLGCASAGMCSTPSGLGSSMCYIATTLGQVRARRLCRYCDWLPGMCELRDRLGNAQATSDQRWNKVCEQTPYHLQAVSASFMRLINRIASMELRSAVRCKGRIQHRVRRDAKPPRATEKAFNARRAKRIKVTSVALGGFASPRTRGETLLSCPHTRCWVIQPIALDPPNSGRLRNQLRELRQLISLDIRHRVYVMPLRRQVTTLNPCRNSSRTSAASPS